MKREITLTPGQQAAFDGLLGGISAGGVLLLQGESGMGKTTILRQAHASLGGAFVGVRQFMSTLVAGEPAAIDEAFLATIEEAVAGPDLVIVDYLHLVTNVVDNYQYARRYLLDAALTQILGEAGARKKKLLFGLRGDAPWPLRRRAYTWDIGAFTAADYAALCGAYL